MSDQPEALRFSGQVPNLEQRLSALEFAAKKALQALTMPCDRWNKPQTLKVNEAIDLLRASLPKEPALNKIKHQARF